MTLEEEDILDADIPMQALAGLAAASARARAAGLPIVVVRDGNLVRIEGDTVTVIKPMPPRVKVTNRQPR